MLQQLGRAHGHEAAGACPQRPRGGLPHVSGWGGRREGGSRWLQEEQGAWDMEERGWPHVSGWCGGARGKGRGAGGGCRRRMGTGNGVAGLPHVTVIVLHAGGHVWAL
jgi:hypothetical protein